ncbi:MAG: RIP metalloprotease RseP [Nitrospirota bacterium]|nr:RIP metalloprotease RseP [Nitrospirota bacterium]
MPIFTSISPDVIYLFAQKLWWFLVVLGVLVTFHEFGHFIVARWAGVRVLKFSLGFGPTLLSRQVGDTEYLVSAIPLGGYVKMFGEDTNEPITPAEQEQSFSHKSLWKRSLIVAAGPGFNFLLSYLIFTSWLALGYPLPVPTFEEIIPTIDAMRPDSPAAVGGLQVGDRIVRVNDKEITTQQDLYAAISESAGRSVTIEVARAGQYKTFVITPEVSNLENHKNQEAPVYVIGIEETAPMVNSVKPDSPAEYAGLQNNDRIIEIEGEPIHTWSQMTKIVRNHPDQPLTLRVLREGTVISLTVTPERFEISEDGVTREIGQLGIMRHGRSVARASTPFDALWQGVEATWSWSELTVVGIYKIITGEISSNNLGGPIMIATVSGTAAENGMTDVVFLVAILSINLGILNLLPIPILDGGHLFFFACEGILRRPVGERQREFAQQVGIVLLFSLMIFAFFNDIQRLLQ